MAKRLFDLFFAAVGVVMLSPLLLLLAVAIRVESAGPIFFRQQRVGRYGKVFRIHKFRTMMVDAEHKGLQITVGADKRVTRVGHLLRKYKLDELPQLLDVLKGDMSLVGPRPEVPRYLDCYPDGVREIVLSVRPGITDRASIEFKDENLILGRAVDAERAYIDEVLPVKLAFYVDYVKTRSLWGDLGIILMTVAALIRR